MSKFTKSSFKSFVKKNRDNLFIKVKSRFDGMCDGVVYDNAAEFVPVKYKEYSEYDLGIDGVWLVGGSRDYFEVSESDGFKCVKVYNCCGSYVLAAPL